MFSKLWLSQHYCIDTPYGRLQNTEKKLDQNYVRMLRAILIKSCKQYPTKQQLYGNLPPISHT